MNKKPTGIFYLTELSVTIQTEKSVIKSVMFPKELVTDGEILDAQGFTEFLTTEMMAVSKKIKVGVIVLGSGLLYQRSIDKGDDVIKAKEELFKTIPFAKKFITEKTIATGSKTYLLATHQLFYQELIEASTKNAITIIAVLPLSLFSDQDVVDSIDPKTVKVILSKEELYEDGNFLEEQSDEPLLEKTYEKDPGVIEDKEPDEVFSLSPRIAYRNVEVWNTSRLVLVLGFLIALTAILGGLIYLQFNKFQLPGQVAKATPTPVISPTPTPAPVVTATAKSDLKVLVENGTGTAGQASKVKALFITAGYTTVDTGNADTSDHDRTEVVFSSNVSKTQQQEVKAFLLKTFTSVTTSIDQAATNDIDVTTGTEK